MKLAWLIAGVLAVAACSATAETVPAGDGAIMAVQTRGGLCREGLCETTIYLERDGSVRGDGNASGLVGLVAAETMAELESQIAAADFEQIRQRPFTGTCPTAFDGQEAVFEFATADGVERIESCVVEVDYNSPLFLAVVAAVGQYVPIGNVGIDDPMPPPPPDPIPLPDVPRP